MGWFEKKKRGLCMEQYLSLLDRILTQGVLKENRTGVSAYTVVGAMIEHDMSEGFPLLTTKKVPFRLISSELEFFIKSITDKKWLQDRKNYIWDEWASPKLVGDKLTRSTISYGSGEVTDIDFEQNVGLVLLEMWNRYKIDHRDSEGNIVTTPKLKEAIENIKESGYLKDPESIFSEDNSSFDLTSEFLTKKTYLAKKSDKELIDKILKLSQLLERDLGPVYGFQWRHFGAQYRGYDVDYTGEGVDQLGSVVNKLKTDPSDRRMLVTAWNPLDLNMMGLPACHYGYQVTVLDGKLNLMWNQRSVDTMLGLPFNTASYGLLLHLLAKESGFKEGKLIGFLGDVHIYENHVESAREQLGRERRELPQVVTDNFESIFKWEYTQSRVDNYNPHPALKMRVAV